MYAYMMILKSRRQSFLLAGWLLLVMILMIGLPMKARALTPEESQIASTPGWHSLPDGKYTYITKGSAPAVGFLKLKNEWYHFDQGGYLSLGWITENEDRYYASPGGKLGKKLGSLKSGYVKVDGTFYMFNQKGKAGVFGKQKLGWVKNKKDVFFYASDGSKLTGLQEINSRIYYFQENGLPKNVGRLKTGWVTIDGKKFYFRPSGKVGKMYGAAYKSATVKIKGKKYTFGPDGAVAQEQVITSEAQKKFIEKIGALAHEDMKKTGVLASVTIAQAIIESAWGTSTLATQARNLFGMKAGLSGTSWKSDWDGAIYRKQTGEYLNGRYVTIVDAFRKYKTIAESVADPSAYLTGAKLSGGALRYAGLVGCRDYTKAATIIKRGGYATAPNYVQALVDVIEKYDLSRFDKD